MKKKKLTQIILLHPSKFVCEGFKKFGAARNISVFYLTTPEPLDYLIKDLVPEAVIIDATFADELSEELSSLDTKLVSVVGIGEVEAYPCLKSPIELDKVFNDLEDLLASSLKSH